MPAQRVEDARNNSTNGNESWGNLAVFVVFCGFSRFSGSQGQIPSVGVHACSMGELLLCSAGEIDFFIDKGDKPNLGQK